MTITEFLLARIAEDEKAARAATAGPWVRTVDEHNGPDDGVDVGIWSDAAGRYPVESMTVGNFNALADGRHIARHDPARVLAECEAKRRIVELHPNNGGSCGTCTDRDYVGLVDDWPCDTLRALASIWADHPDFPAELRAD